MTLVAAISCTDVSFLRLIQPVHLRPAQTPLDRKWSGPFSTEKRQCTNFFVSSLDWPWWSVWCCHFLVKRCDFAKLTFQRWEVTACGLTGGFIYGLPFSCRSWERFSHYVWEQLVKICFGTIVAIPVSWTHFCGFNLFLRFAITRVFFPLGSCWPIYIKIWI